MAANNYYGYSNQGAGGQHSYPVQQTPTSAPPVPSPYGIPNPDNHPVGSAGYPSYSGGDYGYGSRQQESPAHPENKPRYQDNYNYGRSSASSSYESKSFMQPSGAQTHLPAIGTYRDIKREEQSHGPWNVPAVNSGSRYSSYESYSESPSCYHPHQKTSFGSEGSSANGSSNSYPKKFHYPNKRLKPKTTPKPSQLHYCDICKISCAGSQTYKEHLEGQKHKKKEAMLKSGVPAQQNVRGSHPQLHCELCDVSCTGADAYTAHIRGAKHQKVVKLHTKLGKPIPSVEPVKINSASSSCTTTHKQSSQPSKSVVSPSSPKPVALKSTTSSAPPTGGPPLFSLTLTQEAMASPTRMDILNEPTSQDESGDGIDVQPVGHDYVEEICNEEGKMIRFQCRLCECSFNDPNAKDMHLKGRRHRLQYKKKVNPQLPVEVKHSNRARKLQEEKRKRQLMQREDLKRHLERQHRWRVERRRYEEAIYWRRIEEEHLFWGPQYRRPMIPEWHPPPLMGRSSFPVPPLMAPPPHLPQPRLESFDDYYIMLKHTNIYPTEQELHTVQKAVSLSERALKLVSDQLQDEKEKENENKEKQGVPRLLRGVMRVGILAKGLILQGDRDLHLTLLCSDKPRRSLLQRVAELLPEQLATLTKDGHEVTHDLDEAQLIIAFCEKPKIQITVSITCPHLKGVNGENDALTSDSEDLLNKEKCVKSLTCLRQVKWFQAHVNRLQSCIVVIRIFRDLCRRVPTWGALPDWALELLIEKSLSSVSTALSPGDATRRVLECVASGVLLPDGPGLQDPCENETQDALEPMTRQQREDITASAQHALRMMAFRQIHKVLGMELLPPQKNRLNRKRQREGTDTLTRKDGKKDRRENVQNAD
ncbi:zinc finger RNA-binding protein 2 isoform X2 [Bombina bombina]|uniref:zinc finger RNA-binding protein 2 isoform X2 n=1 Tax=Bombina bombina TaxID=8345 RepID=UPI00235A5FF4|nr:zinc finger RNA-binding protein 2 isoform X2 [Bombina bombina]